MTRGRDSNIAYVALDRPDDTHATPSPEEVTAKTILHGVLQHSGVELSAHQTIEAEQEHWSSFAQLAAEYLTIAAEAQRDRWIAELAASGLTDEQVDDIVGSDSFGPLAAELRRAEAGGQEIAEVLPRIVTQRSLDDAEDIGAVLVSRLRHVTGRSRRSTPAGATLVAGLVPVADGPMADDMRRALNERQALMEQRAAALADAAVAQGAPWVKRFGHPPSHLRPREQWLAQVRIVAAYRDRYGVDGTPPVSADVATDLQCLDAARARRAVRRAVSVSNDADSRQANQLAHEGPALG
jgi:hypothetical protein